MRKQLEQQLLNGLMPYIQDQNISDAAMKITIILSNYEISKAETELTVYEGDVNQEMLKRFLMAKIAGGRSLRTVQFYKQSVSKALETIGKPYTDITADDIRLYLAIRVQRDQVSKTTANNERRNLSSFYQWLQREEILLKNPMSKVENIKETKQKKKAFSQMEIEQLRYACRSSRETAIIETLLSTWCRVTEVSSIKKSDIKDSSITVLGKGDKVREVYLNPKAQLAIERYLDDRNDNNPFLFPRAKYAGDVVAMTRNVKRKNQADWYKNRELVADDGHTEMSTIESIVRNIGKRAKVDNCHPHRFRRTGATMALRAGMPLLTVSKLLGHENIGTTQIYLDITDKELEQAHEKYVY